MFPAFLNTRNASFVVAIISTAVSFADSDSENLLCDSIGFSGASLHLRHYVDLSAGRRLISMTTQPPKTGNRDLFVTTQDGFVYAVKDSGSGTGIAEEWFNYNTAIDAAVVNASDGYALETPTATHGGLRAIAFHPEFATNGKFYTSAMVDRPDIDPGLNYLGASISGFDGESVLAEWTYDAGANQVIPTSYRELFRIQMPVFDHPIKQIAFNHFASAGDPDYGLLYVAHGDGSVQSAIAGGGQVSDDALGKILRINPLESGGIPYTTPENPFVTTPGTLNEIYTLGHRNPHHISFAKDANGIVQIIVAEPGRDNIEEVNILIPGADYGWSNREGTFVHNNNGGPNGNGYGLDYGVSSLPNDEWQLNDFIYPAAQYDHDKGLGQAFGGIAIAGGFVIDNFSDPLLQGQYIFANFGPLIGFTYQASASALFGAHTQLADNEAPESLTQATISRLTLTLDDDADGTIDTSADDLNTLFNVSRNNVRFGRGVYGEMFVSSKTTGKVYVVTNSIPTYTSWSTATLPNGADQSFEGDADGNGIANGLEYALGSEFSALCEDQLLAPQKIVPADVDLEFQISSDLVNWSTAIQWINGEATVQNNTFSVDRGVIETTNSNIRLYYRYQAMH